MQPKSCDVGLKFLKKKLKSSTNENKVQQNWEVYSASMSAINQ